MPRIRPESESGASTASLRLATVGRIATRAGTVITVTAAPLALVTFLLVLTNAPTLGAGIDAAATAISGPLALGGEGVGWLLHVAVFGLLTGTWILGAGLVISGLTD